MKNITLIVLPLLVLCSSSIKAQTALSSTTSSQTLQYTVSNSSGFSIKNNGSLDYQGPLNNLLNQSVEKLPSAEMQVNDSKYSPPDSLIESSIKNKNKLNSLNPELTEVTIPGSKRPRRITLSYTTTVPSVISVKLRESLETRQVVDSQSISIFPSAFPSSF